MRGAGETGSERAVQLACSRETLEVAWWLRGVLAFGESERAFLGDELEAEFEAVEEPGRERLPARARAASRAVDRVRFGSD